MATVERYFIVPEDQYRPSLTQSVSDQKQLRKTMKESPVKDVDPQEETSDDTSDDSHVPTQMSRQSPNQSPDIAAHEPLSEHAIINKVPARFRPRARRLLQTLTDDDLMWDGRGQLVTPEAGVIKGSSISDILRHMIKPFKKRYVIGLKYVERAIKNAHLPKDIHTPDVKPTLARHTSVKWVKF